MRCPWCKADDDKVVDSRLVDRGGAVRRRRECKSCRRRFTTFERVEGVGLWVVKRDGTREPFDRDKVAAGISKAIKNRPVTVGQVDAMADRIEERLLRKGPEVTSQQIGLEVLAQLKKADHIAYMRFASVYKDFQDLGDFERELGGLLEKKVPAKARVGRGPADA
jgi:transcriptional repressor NrdR